MRPVDESWALAASYARPVLGPHEPRALETLVRVLRDTDLDPGLLRRVVGVLFHLTRGTARTIAESREAAEMSGMSEEEWWDRSSEALSTVVPDFANRFPDTQWLFSASSSGQADLEASGYVDAQARANLAAGLEILLAGIEAGSG